MVFSKPNYISIYDLNHGIGGPYDIEKLMDLPLTNDKSTYNENYIEFLINQNQIRAVRCYEE